MRAARSASFGGTLVLGALVVSATPAQVPVTLLPPPPVSQQASAVFEAAISPDAGQRCRSLLGGRFAELPGAPTWVVKTSYRDDSAQRPAHCEVEGYVNPVVNFGMLLPARNWNGKFMVRGCGGSCGTVLTEGACGRHLRDGYACLHTDMGHRSDQSDNNWVANNLQGLVDFGYRATHVATVAGKAIAAAFFSAAPTRSYFFGCSTGGRQALIEAQRFPQDFDGIVAVAPVAVNGFGQPQNWSSPALNQADGGGTILTDAHVPLIYKAVVARCDARDGLRDGIVDPRDCDFDPASLQCAAGEVADPRRCLTAAQVETTRRFYARGAARGSELNWIDNWTARPGPPREFAQSRGDVATIETLNNAGNPDLRAFRDRGGKLILAHGLTDLIVTPQATIDYYELASRTMGGLEATQRFFRLFLLPGVDHCSGGEGAWGVGYVRALEAWVERGEAPQQLLGLRPRLGVALDYFGLDSHLLAPQDIEFSRPHFAYPLKAYHSGRGDPAAATSFSPALVPPRRIASPARSTAPTSAEALAAELLTLATATERAYLASGLPPKNVADRVAKAVRRRLYLDVADAGIARDALQRLRAPALSPLVAAALEPVLQEYADAH